MSAVKIFGIRHHGPGSARALNLALNDFNPDCVLIEGDPSLKNLTSNSLDGLIPPIAGLISYSEDYSKSIFNPFAIFSPEWQALLWIHKNNIYHQWIDLPYQIQDLFSEKNPKAKSEIEKDPLGYLSTLAGFKDHERWWDYTFERPYHSTEVFVAVANMMRELRKINIEDPQTLARETWMRQEIRTHVKQGFKNIAVICGAWHLPNLENWESTEKTDKPLLNKIGKPKKLSKAIWVPWSYKHLTIAELYNAGVEAPIWYETLFLHGLDGPIFWTSLFSHEAKNYGIEVPGNLATDMYNTAQALSLIRNLPLPGLDEFEDAANSCLGKNGQEIFKILINKLTVGNVIGQVPNEADTLPILENFYHLVKTLRLTRNINRIDEHSKNLDLREDNDLSISSFFHRLLFLDVHWARLEDLKSGLGNFKEIWTLKWNPGIPLEIMQSDSKSLTIEDAIISKIELMLPEEKNPVTVANLLVWTFRTDLFHLIPTIQNRLDELILDVEETGILLDTVVEISLALRYGDIRRSDPSKLEETLLNLFPRICSGLIYSTLGIESDEQKLWLRRIIQCGSIYSKFKDPEIKKIWESKIALIHQSDIARPYIRGGCFRLLLDWNLKTKEETFIEISKVLSPGENPMVSCEFLEGFIGTSSLSLLYEKEIFGTLDRWLNERTQDEFRSILPLLRRSFSQYGKNSKSQLMDLAVNLHTKIEKSEGDDQKENNVISPWELPGFEWMS
jgi:hypothetical protein